jgi:uncharacterized protein YndB with AHSA1/START domain
MSAFDGARPSSPMPQAFACFVAADPARVWAALTDAQSTSAFMYGLAASSTWEIDAPIEFQSVGDAALTGRVVCVQPQRRLSYLVQAGPDDPPVYLTWLIRPSPGGVTVRLHVDEIEYPDDAEEAEEIWLPMLAALQRTLST